MRKQGIWGIGVLALGLSPLAGLQAQTVPPQTAIQAHQATAPKGDLPGPIDSLKDLEDTGRLLFMMADQNRDGQISQKEATNAADLIVGGFFFSADTNGDGVVSPEEARQARENLLQTRPWLRYVVETAKATPKPGQTTPPAGGQQTPFRALQTVFDSNNDRQLQATELRQGVQTVVQGLFTTADTNRDNQLSPTEVNAAIDGMIASAAQGAFQAADTDHNGALSLQEWDRSIEGPAHVVFNVFDGNHDGQLTAAEAQQAERVIITQLRSIRVPSAPNSLSNLIRTGRLPREVAPVPRIGVGTADQQVQPTATVPVQPARR
jgi:Ca2+-binding EF-hand superfamily protein